MIQNIKRGLAAGKGKAFNKAMESMINGLKYAGYSQDKVLEMCRAVWKKQGMTKKQIKLAEDDFKKRYK